MVRDSAGWITHKIILKLKSAINCSITVGWNMISQYGCTASLQSNPKLPQRWEVGPPLPPARYAWPRLLLGYKPAAQRLCAMGMKAIPLPTIFIYIPFKGYSPSTPIIPFGYKIFKSAVMTLPQRKKGDCMKF